MDYKELRKELKKGNGGVVRFELSQRLFIICEQGRIQEMPLAEFVKQIKFVVEIGQDLIDGTK